MEQSKGEKELQVTEDVAELLKPAEKGDGQLIIQVPCADLFDADEKREPARTLLILVCDQSGSMSHYFKDQVVPALLHVVGQSFALPHLEAEVIIYQSNAKRLQLNQENYVKVISPLRAGGGTSFSAAFKVIQTILDERLNEFEEVVIGFLTDGQDSGWKSGGAYDKLRTFIHEDFASEKKITVHAIAFTENHDFDLLNTLRKDLGNVEGGFQYAEPSDGPDALRGKLEAVFESVSVKASTATLTVTLPGYNFVEYGLEDDTLSNALKQNVTIRDGVASIAGIVREESSVYSFNMGGGGENLEAVVEIVPDESDKTAKRSIKVQVKELCAGPTTEKFKMKQIEGRIATLSKAIADGATGTPTESERKKWSKAIDDIQAKIEVYQGVNMLRMFKKSDRSEMFEAIHALTQKINQLRSLLAEMAKGSMSTAQKARLAELTYGHKFQRATRARKLDERAERNVAEMAKSEEAVKSLTFDTDSLKGFKEDLLDSFRCVLSQFTWADLLVEEEKDVVGFGIAVGRPETSVDDPTQVRIYDISITTVAKSSFEDALKYSIDTKGHIPAHGGFELGSEMGVALRGMGREPINTWVPLYINKEHWKLVYAQIKPILGYLVTLDPLGYNSNQIDVLFLILATMVARLQNPGERELIVLFQMLRTCIQLARDIPNLLEKTLKNLRAFTESPANRLKDVTKNLLVFMGYLLVLPIDKLDTVLGTEEDWELLWFNILTEAVRRSADSIFKFSNESEVDAFIESVVTGEKGAAGLSETEIKNQGFWNIESIVEVEHAERPEYSSFSQFAATKGPKGGSGGSSQQGNSGQEGEEDGGDWGAESAWGAPQPERGNSGRGRGGRGRGAVQSSTRGGGRGGRGSGGSVTTTRPTRTTLAELPERDERMVKFASCLTMGGLGEQSTQTEEDDGPRYNASAINNEILESLEWFQSKCNRQGHPTMSAIMSIVCFARIWNKMQRTAGGLDVLLERIDEHAGVAPEEWIKEVKEGFAKDRKGRQASFVCCFDLLEAGIGGGGRVTKCSPLNVVRAMAVQGSKLRVNKTCREALTEGGNKYLDPVTAGDQLLQELHKQIVSKQKASNQKQTRNQELKYAIQRCVSTNDILMFVGYLTSKKGLGGQRSTAAFQELYWQFQNVDTSNSIPLGIEKLKILILGKAELTIDGVQTTVNVLDGGKAWLPGERKSKKKYHSNVRRFRRIWGAAFDEILAAAAKENHL